MLPYVIGRLVQACLSLFVIVSIVFLLTRLSGDPAALYAQDAVSDEVYEAIRARLGLDRPIWEQYAIFLRDAATGDLGDSWRFNRSAVAVTLEHLPATFMLAGSAFTIAVIVGIPLGVVSALYRGTWVDRFGKLVALVGQAVPTFWLGLMLILLFAVQFGLLPTGGRGGLSHLIMPALALSGFSMAAITRVTRSAVLDELDQDYVRTARAKGLSNSKVVVRHALRNAWIPVVTIMGLLLSGLLGGSVVTEQVFSWPGIGRLAVQSIEFRDFPVIQAVVLLTASVYLLINLAVDLLYGAIDPRIRVGQGR